MEASNNMLYVLEFAYEYLVERLHYTLDYFKLG